LDGGSVASSSVVETRPRGVDVTLNDEELIVLLGDGRRISIPITWFPRLLHGGRAERQNFELLGEGEASTGLILMKISAFAGLLLGTPSRR
jgi:hypothetical protein